MHTSALRTRWAAIGAAVAVTLGAGGVGLVAATSPAGAVAYVPIEPCRAADTRPGIDNVGPRATPLGATETHVVNSNHGQCAGDVPGTATGLQLNVTAVGATEGSFITIWASGARPLASSLNPTPGQPPVPNAVTTSITGAGNFNIYNNAGSVHVIVDIVGYYTDHNHDDRYYTETEVDTALGTKADSTDLDTKVSSDDGKSAYAWSCSAAQALGTAYNVTTNCGYSYNPSGSDVTVTRSATGVYLVSFPGLNMSEGHVQVTAYGSGNDWCNIGGWSGSSMSVRCWDSTGAAVDSLFTILALD